MGNSEKQPWMEAWWLEMVPLSRKLCNLVVEFADACLQNLELYSTSHKAQAQGTRHKAQEHAHAHAHAQVTHHRYLADECFVGSRQAAVSVME